MDTINRPRSITKAVAVTAITLTVAGFATALGIGMRGVLWEVQRSTAELNKASAAMEEAKASMAQAQSTVTAAQKQAEAMIASAKLAADATMKAAERSVEAAEKRNYIDIATTDKVTGPAVLDPINEHTQLTKQIGILKNEISTDSEYKTERMLTAAERQAKENELGKATRQLGVVQNYTGANLEGLINTFFHGVAGGFKQFLDSTKTKPSSRPN